MPQFVQVKETLMPDPNEHSSVRMVLPYSVPDTIYWTKGSYWLSLSHYFESFTVLTMTCLASTAYVTNDHVYVPSRNRNSVLSSFMANHQILSKSDTIGARTAW